jgi:hypothetical protein
MWETILRIARFVKKKKKITGPYNKEPFRETDTQFQPWDKIYLDIVRLLNMTKDGYKYILTCHDNLSKYLLAIPMLTQTAEVILTFLHHIPHFMVYPNLL